ncbi:MAG: NADH-quinone oxidoreductase subunit N [Calditrichaeota bacterium]|nr:NADH-quinone oxidoreductase subunit N [Calditrichota bacterium]RQV98093.1 MAG: NADH-quinone oxidoreductase subunit N [Calditrichota bacterium]
MALSPLIILASGSLIIMMTISVKRNHAVAAGISLLTLAGAFFALIETFKSIPHKIEPMVILDSYAVFFMGLILIAGFFVTAFSYNYLSKGNKRPEEYYILLLLATLGTVVLVISNHFVTFFLGLEILSVSLYTLIAYSRENLIALEAGLKYLILAAFSSAFLIFGMALVYAEVGTMNFMEMGLRVGLMGWTNLILLAGIALMIVGFGFKLAVVPFHMWTPDVYQGASAPVTAFIATVSKGGMFALLFRLFITAGAHTSSSVLVIFTFISIASMFAGNILALLQNNVKRILAYSSIAHLGYLLVAFIAGQQFGMQAAAFYLVAYFITTLGAFGVISMLSDEEREPDRIGDYRGLFWRRPWISLVLSAMLFSLAGIPLTAGFIGKFYVVAAGVKSTLWILLIILVINSAIGLYYYLRIIVSMFSRTAPEEKPSVGTAVLPLSGGVVLAVLTILLIWLGIFPADIMLVIQRLVSGVAPAAPLMF